MYKLTNLQNSALSAAKEGHNLLVLGQSGTGKSFLTKRIASDLRNEGKKVAVTATTGIAALGVGGRTIHSWAGIGDGRFSGEGLLAKLRSSEHYYDKKQDILQSQCLIIDEISMLSLKLFETLEYVCRKLRDSKVYFGGLQVIGVGDFFQLPPVPDYLKMDQGKYCFESEHFQNMFKHRIILKEVMRQSEYDFIKCINDISRGELPLDSHNLVRRLNRPLPPGPKPIRLCVRKFDCDVYNASNLIDMQGTTQSYIAIDSGEKRFLKSLSVPHELHLKVDCPIILLKNLSDTLVNGLRGKVTRLSSNSVFVYFDSISKEVNLKPETFTVYSSIQDRVIATRIQIPVCLAFSITIHKAQGLTLDRVEVDSGNIFSAGQLGVAIGRTREKKNLRILNFTPSAVIKHDNSVYEFYENSQCLQSDLGNSQECCRLNHYTSSSEPIHENIRPSNIDACQSKHSDGGDDEMSDFNESELHEIDKYNIMENDFTNFENKIKAKFTEIFNKAHSSEICPKSWKDYYSAIYKFSVSNEYIQLVEEEIGRKPISDDFNILRKSFDKVTSLILKEKTTPLEKAQIDVAQTVPDDCEETEACRGKIRYIGGGCIAKCRYHFMKATRSSLYKQEKNQTTSSSYLKVKMLDYLTWNGQALQSSQFPCSLEETKTFQVV